MKIARFCFPAALGALLLVACSGEEQAKAPAAYDLRFPSLDVAVASQTIEVFVFDPLAKENRICDELLVKRRSGQDLGQAIGRMPPAAICDVLSGNSEPVDVGYGTWAFLAVVQESSTDYLLGCALANVGPGSAKPVISLSYAAATAPQAPVTTCLDLGQKCKGTCQ